MHQEINIACTRLLNPSLKTNAVKNHIHLQDHSFLTITYPENSVLQEAIANNAAPFVFTSAYAVEAVANTIKKNQLKIANPGSFCILGNTSAMAKEFGFKLLTEAGNSMQLAQKILAFNPQQVLYCTSNIRRNELITELQSKKISVDIIEVYHKALLPKKINAFDAVMFFSPSQIDAFLTLNSLHPMQPAFCLGATTAAHLASLKHTTIITSKDQSEQGMLDEIYQYYKINQ